MQTTCNHLQSYYPSGITVVKRYNNNKLYGIVNFNNDVIADIILQIVITKKINKNKIYK